MVLTKLWSACQVSKNDKPAINKNNENKIMVIPNDFKKRSSFKNENNFKVPLLGLLVGFSFGSSGSVKSFTSPNNILFSLIFFAILTKRK